MPIFNNYYDYKRFIKTFTYYSTGGPKPKLSHFASTVTTLDPNKKIVGVVCFCLIPNHFHFLLLQKGDGGITEFASKVSNSYTKYFNNKNKRIGPLLQGEFKSVHIETIEQLLHLTRYIHLNPLINYVTNNLNAYPWSSYLEYVGDIDHGICGKEKEIALAQFKSPNLYQQFVLDQEDYARQLELTKHQLLDFEEYRQANTFF